MTILCQVMHQFQEEYSALSYLIESNFFLVVFVVLSVMASFMKERRQFKEYNLRRQANDEVQRYEDILAKLMPYTELMNLKVGSVPANIWKDVPILYADITGFTAYSCDKTPQEVVSMLSVLFSRFDALCERFDVFKVYTIGDCYVVIGFKDRKDYVRDIETEVDNTLAFAFAMRESIEQINQENKMGIGMRIGLHVGDIITGVTGSNVVRFDMYGTDAMIANKMESEGERGKVNVSERVRQLIEESRAGDFLFEFNKQVPVKYAGQVEKHLVDCYFVEKAEKMPLPKGEALMVKPSEHSDSVKNKTTLRPRLSLSAAIPNYEDSFEEFVL